MPGDDPETFAVIGAAMEVHRVLGRGFLEAVYRDALCQEMIERRIPFIAEVTLPVYYKDVRLRTSFRADLVCFDRLLVELKALKAIGGAEIGQTINYLKASRLTKALLLNFGGKSLEYQRLILSPAGSNLR
jgi:GxxExxY protein